MIYLLSQMIDQSAVSYPARQAFRFQEQSITYAELSRATNQLAGTLRDLGVARGDRVGVFMNKSLEMPLAVHGILKAGAAYVPIDPAAPANRLQYILQDCGIRILITQKSKLKRLAAIIDMSGLECLIGVGGASLPAIFTVSWEDIHKASDEAPKVGPVTEMDLAYIMYTSGSTGEPKGIMHTHHSGLSYAKLSAETYQLCEEDILGNHSPLHFDMSTFEFFSGPLRGACSVLIPEEYTKLPASLSKLIADEGMTVWYSVPFALIQLLLRGALDARDLGTLRWIMFGGEPFPAKYLRDLMKQLPGTSFSNVYGPAEVNQCTYYHVPRAPEGDDPVAIGRAWANCESLVIDENDQPVSPGEKGELLIRSPTMMQGYWNRQDLTERALYHRYPYPGFRKTYYRTGDLVRINGEGHLVFLGRKDRQIKTRGHRVELDEIEITLLNHDDVKEAAAFAYRDVEGNVLISAGVTLKDHQASPAVNLMQHVKARLPWYAVPQRIKIYGAFSRTATGKIDRNALKEDMVDGSGQP
ncbi:MAG: amino acid adenylation domain-containing protein [Desulfobacterales bacterium]|nr:amino acid adenylation domain-containing protein [Desulfobacterales bacterium]